MTIWQHRAASVGLSVLDNKRLSEMTDVEIQSAFDALGRRYGIHYIW